MNIQDIWLARFKEVVDLELKETGKLASAYKSVAMKIGLNPDYVYQIYKGKPEAKPKKPSAEVMDNLERVYGSEAKSYKTTAQPYHDTIREPDTVPYLSIESKPQKLRDASDIVISQYDTGGAMGSGVLLKDQPGVIKEWRVSDDWLRLNVHRITSPKNLAIVTGFGDSMRGMFNPGDPLLVDTGIKQFEGDAVYFFRVGDEGFVKRLQSIPGEGLLVISENKGYRDWTIKDGMIFEVFGKVVKVWKGEEF